ncbi:alpha-2-macroglobulin-like isoform X1 [Podarcis lilfordi]|uniref:Alpha-2-macroglobulin-like isoform X1 n=1 Tax=Podarcis lilfordi TaxID=74358 RepID=A0AA35K048_9SAUR|nr:alpha-2-macroglobulin-like isoform X1 [Podarcis lilfordi]
MMGKGRILGGPSAFLFLLLLLLGDISAPSTMPHHLVLVPFVLQAETSEKICVHVRHLNESVTVSITLENLAETRTSHVVSKTNLFQCIPFRVPRLSNSPDASEATLTVEVEVKVGLLIAHEQKQVLVRNPESLVFVQTDKPIYKPGQEVRFRIMSVDKDFRPLNETFPLVYIQDPKRNRLLQWTNVEQTMGLVQLSFPLSSEPPQGTYKVVVQKASGNKVERLFEVKEYVLPKFEVLVKAPKEITFVAEELEVTVCGLYTYGKPVAGQVKARVCRKYNEHRGWRVYSSSGGGCHREASEGICEEFSGEANGHGCLSQVVKTNIFHLKREGYEMNLKVEGKITEEGTGVELTGTASTMIITTLSTITFENVDSYYKSGIPFTGQVKLLDAAKVPIANETIQIRVHLTGTSTNYVTDDQGRAHFSIDTDNFTAPELRIQATYKSNSACEQGWISPQHQSASHSAGRFYSPSQSYLHIERVPGTLSCGQTQTLRVHYILNSAVVKEQEMVFYYLVMAKGVIVRSGTHVLPVEHREGTAKGVFSLDLSVDMDTAPLARLLLYTILPSRELVAHSADFTVENCFTNKVNLWFSDAEGLPTSKTHLHLAASKGSLCAVHAVDKSVFLLKPEAEMSPKTVYDLLPVKDLRGYVYRHHYLLDPYPDRCTVRKNIVVEGISYRYESFQRSEGDAYDILKDFGLKVFTSTKIQKPNLCREEIPVYATAGLQVQTLGRRLGAPGIPAREAARTERQQETVRSYFPETWLWNTWIVNGESQGEIDIPVTIPDTITEWKAGAFCLSPDVGFGLAQTASLRAFQPFFLDMTMPYSVVRGEAFTLKATVFTYMQRCVRVSISLAPSAEFVASPVEKEEESYCLCANERKTVSWTVTPKSLGEINFTASAEALNSEQLCGNEIVETLHKGQKDTVIKSLLVKPEGVERDVVFNNLLCAVEKPKSSQPVSLKLPGNVVEGSARASFCVLGDILGSAIENLHQLLQMPYGCGEQNMALFAPNIYILEYLNKTEQLTEEVKSKALGYLVAGYQRQLNYKHSDGSYSTFGQDNRSPGNTWLTAFTLKSFSRARPYIFVEEKHVQDAQAYLAARQRENGCFRSIGTLWNNALKGGVDDEISLSAYITAALLESHLPLDHPTVRNALFCLETAAAQAKEIHVYSLALLAYSFALAGKEEQRQKMLQLLHEEAVQEEDGSLHWQRPGKKEVDKHLSFFGPPRAPSAEVEMTAYVLLSYLTKQPAPSHQELGTATRVVKWLSRQQNPTGGFSSTQDTVVALQALSLYGALTYSKSSTGPEVTLSSTGGVLRQFHVDSTNRLLLQCQALPRVPGDYVSTATGEGCVHVQTTLKYNVQPHQEEAPFMLEVHTVPETCAGPKAHKTFDVAINVSYTGNRLASNMAIVDVKMLSGFVPVKPSVKQLESHNLVQRTEVSTSHVLLYLEKVTNMTQSYTFTVEQDVPVQNLKPAVARVYDYYETDDGADAEYSAPCSTAETKQGNA